MLISFVCLLFVATCNNGDIRLNNNGNFTSFYGVVEVCLNGQFGVICDDGWDANEALVLCKQLGFPSNAREQ